LHGKQKRKCGKTGWSPAASWKFLVVFAKGSEFLKRDLLFHFPVEKPQLPGGPWGQRRTDWKAARRKIFFLDNTVLIWFKPIAILLAP